MDPRDLKTALFCISFLRKGEVLAYVGRIHNLKDLKDPHPENREGVEQHLVRLLAHANSTPYTLLLLYSSRA